MILYSLFIHMYFFIDWRRTQGFFAFYFLIDKIICIYGIQYGVLKYVYIVEQLNWAK